MKPFTKLLGIIALVVVVIISVFAIQNRQQIYDSIILRGYTPSENVKQLADNTTMTDRTRRVFYVNRPEIDDKDRFKGVCKTTEQSIVLGCYVENDGIFLLDVKDQRLSGVMEVTSAHEVLHAEYDRLNKTQREEVDKMTANFFATIKDDRIKKTIENYRKKDPSVVPNELHSILGSEVRDLTPELEAHYAEYFTNRKAVVAYSEQYEQVFTDLKNEQDRYVARLDQIKADFNTKLEQLNALETQRAQFKAELDSLRGQDKINEYNSRVDSYNALVVQRNALIPSLKALSSESEDVVNKYNNSIVLYQGLIQAIDANSVPKSL